MKVLQNMKTMLLSIALAIGVGTIGFAMFANAQSIQSSPSPFASQAQKDTDKETNDDTAKTTDNHQDGETNDDGTVTKSPTTN